MKGVRFSWELEVALAIGALEITEGWYWGKRVPSSEVCSMERPLTHNAIW